MTDYQVFIPTRGRPHVVRRLADIWHDEGFEVTFVVEPDEALDYIAKVPDCRVDVLSIKNAGIGNARNHCVSLAASWGFKTMILADDDIKPGKFANMDTLVRSANHHKVLGVTARYSYHELALGYEIKHRDDLILLPTGTFRLVSLNVDNVLKIGNYDAKLEYAEDCDLFLRGLQAGFPWMIHLGTWSNSIGNRYEPGGMLDFAGGADNLSAKKEDWHWDLYDKYPDFINDPAKADFTKQNSIRVAWRKAYDKLLPSWRDASALHGGNIDVYLGDEE